MGRKLNALEEIQNSLADPRVDQQGPQAQVQQQYLERIADTLGINIAELGAHPAPPNAIQPLIDMTRQNEFVLTQQCADLVRAFVEIQEPQDRLRCLQIVRDAAGVKSPGSDR